MDTPAMRFESYFNEVNTFGHDVKNDQIKNEPMFFNSSFDFAMERGGPITKAFLNALPMQWKTKCVFDSRIHMLMPDWYPAIPGWHHDDVPRQKDQWAQPNYADPEYRSEHILGLVNSDICPTLFAEGVLFTEEIKEGQTVYAEYHKLVEEAIRNESLAVTAAKDRTLYLLNWQTFHTGTKAKASGWRWFGRISRNTDRIFGITNEIRVNAQVYLEFPNKGW